jgi:hypothetical protein
LMPSQLTKNSDQTFEPRSLNALSIACRPRVSNPSVTQRGPRARKKWRPTILGGLAVTHPPAPEKCTISTSIGSSVRCRSLTPGRHHHPESLHLPKTNQGDNMVCPVRPSTRLSASAARHPNRFAPRLRDISPGTL